ncbi:MAG: hypothetical protein ACLGHS_07970 [Actinomycetes bacterium]
MAKKRWSDLTDGEKTLVLTLGSTQLALATTAWLDLATRPHSQVNGPKGAWAVVIGLNLAGPLLYFWKGVRREPPAVR